MDKIVAGVDIGGSHITTALVNLSAKSIYQNTMNRQAVNSHGAVAEIIHSWCSSLRSCFRLQNLNPGKIGIAIPGPFDYENGISLIKNQDKYDSLYQLNVKRLIADELGIDCSGIKLKNDAVCFLQGEVFSGSAVGYNHAVGLTLGTGLGSAIYQDGEVRDADKWCSPFRESIAEDYISSRWFVQRYQELSGQKVDNVKQLAGLPNEEVEVVFTEFGYNLADFIILNFAEATPQVVVLGGNISHTINRFLPSLQERLNNYKVDCHITKATHNENAALMGAAACWSEPATAKKNGQGVYY